MKAAQNVDSETKLLQVVSDILTEQSSYLPSLQHMAFDETTVFKQLFLILQIPKKKQN